MDFVEISYAFQQCKNFENRLRFDKVTESFKVGTFLRHSVVTGVCGLLKTTFRHPQAHFPPLLVTSWVWIGGK